MPDEIVTEQPPEPKRGKGLIWTLVLLVVCAGAGGAGYVFWPQAKPADEAPTQESVGPALYYALDPALVVNFQGGGRVRYLQLGIQVMTRDPDALEAMKLHTPVIRNNLIMLLSDQSYDKLLTHEGKESLRQAALKAVQAVMQKKYGKPAIEELYFTSFVMQ